MQNTLFSNFNEEEAVQKLQDLGYRVFKVEYPDAKGVSKINDLITFFYARRSFYNKGDKERKFPESIDFIGDRKSLDSFVKSRQKLGLSRKMAIQEAAVMIDTMFKYEEVLNLKAPILSPLILTQRWFIDRIVGILNGNNQSAIELDNEKAIDEWNDWYNSKYAKDDLIEAQKRCERLLEELNGRRK